MPPNLPTLVGKKALEEDFAGFFAENTARHETQIEEILIEGGLSIERSRYRMTAKPRAAGAEVVDTGRHLEVRRKEGGKWKIVWEIWNSDVPAK
jgi:ketosteroid isomerase-like protein